MAIIDGKPSLRRLQAGETLSAGATGTDYLLSDGVLRVEIDGKVTELGPGAVVGEMALLEGDGARPPCAVTPRRDRRRRRRPS